MNCLLKKFLLLISIGTSLVFAENTSFNSYHFSGSGNCATCHNGISDDQGNDVSIEKAWSSTMMANATKDPLWKAKVRSEINRNPQLEGVISDKCTKCHAPMASKEAHFNGEAVKLFGAGGFLDPQSSHHDEAMNGISCTLCHQVKDNGKLGTLEGMSGNLEVDESRTIYGPYDNVRTGPMRNNVNYNIQYSAHIKDSKMCASCHNLKTPFVDDSGNILSTTPESEFPEQMPYSEWEHSSYKDTESCQDCHMKRTNGVVMASRPGNLNTKRDGFSQHIFVGGNKTLLDILNNNKAALGVNSNNFAETLAKTDEMLRSSANIEMLNQSVQDGTMEISMKINSQTGHKLPTSFPSRRAFLHVTVTDQTGTVVFESGKVNADGSIVGADSDADRAVYEPHYDLITSQDQVQIYETVMGNNLGEVTYTLLRALEYKKDNRILPTGFNKATAPSDIKVAGSAMADGNFVGGSDTITYRVGGLDGGTYTIDAELLYQTLSYPFAQDLFTDTSAEAASFKGMYNASSMKTSQIASSSLSVEVIGGSTPPLPAAACDDGIDNDGDGLTDLADPGCTDASDDDEFNVVTPPPPAAACDDGIDNDGDGLTDLADPGCTDASDDDEFNVVTPPPAAACDDGIDNDGDGLTDLADPGCTDASDNDEFNVVTPPPTTACSDGIDNDGDGRIDLADRGCQNAADDNEWNRGRW